MLNDSSSRSIDSTVKIDDNLVDKSSFAFFEEMVEWFFKLMENSSVLNKFWLHFWCNLLIEVEFFNNQVEIKQKRLFDIFSDIVV